MVVTVEKVLNTLEEEVDVRVEDLLDVVLSDEATGDELVVLSKAEEVADAVEDVEIEEDEALTTLAPQTPLLTAAPSRFFK